ncbi:MAG: diguanylate cyclase [Deltaproteobacteria bacterium]|nr:diguanylate cyclase [Deltaproteobacteria bacterium]
MRVLIADDEPLSSLILEHALVEWGYEVISARDGDEAWSVLQGSEPPRMAVLDWMMPGRDGLNIIRGLRDPPRDPYTYLLLLTARSHHEDLIQAMEAGADDFLAKPFDPEELRVRLRAGRRIVELQEQLVAAREELRAQATHDSLTGVWNRGSILEAMARELERGEREKRPFSIAMADVDYFKSVNDRLGHQVGDVVLSEVARRMSARVRPYDMVGRYGGEEFLVVLPGCDSREAQRMVERLRAEVGMGILVNDQPAVYVTLSFGVSTFKPGSGLTCEKLLRSADGALYAAKDLGRNRAVTGT